MWLSRRLICSLIKQATRPAREQRAVLSFLCLSLPFSFPLHRFPSTTSCHGACIRSCSGYVLRNDEHTTARCGRSSPRGRIGLSSSFDSLPTLTDILFILLIRSFLFPTVHRAPVRLDFTVVEDFHSSTGMAASWMIYVGGNW